MGSQHSFNRIRYLASEHEFTVAYIQWAHEAHWEYSKDFRVVSVAGPVVAEPPAVSSRSRAYWRLNAWRHALFESEPAILYGFGQPELQSAFGQLLRAEQPDIVHVIGFLTLYSVPINAQNILADLLDVFSRMYERNCRLDYRLTRSFQSLLEWKKMERVERAQLRRARALLTVSDLDRQTVERLAPGIPSHVIPTSVDVDYFQPTNEEAEPATLLFTGSMNYSPNIEAVAYFCNEIFPRVLAKFPEARLEIVGANPFPEVLALAGDRVHVVGGVPDMRPYFARATLCIVPLKNGAGTRIKIVEAWAMKKAVVSTGVGAEGLLGKPMEHFWLANEASEFADAIIQLLRKPELRRRLGENGRDLVLAHYSLAVAAEKLNQVYLSMH